MDDERVEEEADEESRFVLDINSSYLLLVVVLVDEFDLVILIFIALPSIGLTNT